MDHQESRFLFMIISFLIARLVLKSFHRKRDEEGGEANNSSLVQLTKRATAIRLEEKELNRKKKFLDFIN